MSVGEDTPEKHRNLIEPWKPGQSGNPKGRPKGARNKLQEAYLADLLAIWEASGKEGLERVMKDDPATIVRVVAGLLPKEVKIDANPLGDMTDDELSRLIDIIRSALPSPAACGSSADEASEPKQITAVSAVH